MPTVVPIDALVFVPWASVACSILVVVVVVVVVVMESPLRSLVSIATIAVVDSGAVVVVVMVMVVVVVAVVVEVVLEVAVVVEAVVVVAEAVVVVVAVDVTEVEVAVTVVATTHSPLSSKANSPVHLVHSVSDGPVQSSQLAWHSAHIPGASTTSKYPGDGSPACV
jgi:hypothetical protein